ncbi:MAG: flavin reductase family protein [Nannocystaceae bacterium]|nr:flavin reductase family protein [Nannocystaceae bacterium]
MSASDEAIDAAGLSARDAYQLMTDLVAPRPIAWVSSCDEHGARNLAPFSYYQAVCSRPPTIVVSIAWRDGKPKDTLRNILATGTFVVNHVDRDHAAAMNATAAEVGPEVDEWDLVARAGAGPITAAPCRVATAPRIAEAKAALECRLVHALPLGQGARGGPSSTLVVAEVLWFWLAAGLRSAAAPGARPTPIDPARLDALGRLGGIAYTDTRGVIRIPRADTGRGGAAASPGPTGTDERTNGSDA